MNYWLIKSEPKTWSWQNQINVKKTSWDGVRNYQARNNLKKMKIGDLCMFYHSVKEKRIVGIVRVIKEAYPDTSDKSKRFVMVDVKTYKKLKNSVSLESIKKDKRLKHIGLIKQTRLSVMSIDSKSWMIILNMSNKNKV